MGNGCVLFINYNQWLSNESQGSATKNTNFTIALLQSLLISPLNVCVTLAKPFALYNA